MMEEGGRCETTMGSQLPSCLWKYLLTASIDGGLSHELQPMSSIAPYRRPAPAQHQPSFRQQIHKVDTRSEIIREALPRHPLLPGRVRLPNLRTVLSNLDEPGPSSIVYKRPRVERELVELQLPQHRPVWSRDSYSRVTSPLANYFSQDSQFRLVPVNPTPEPVKKTRRPLQSQRKGKQKREAEEGGEEEAKAKVPRKINVACGFCRMRKLRCDGGRPRCYNCMKRTPPCEYVPEPKRRGPGKKPKKKRGRDE